MEPLTGGARTARLTLSERQVRLLLRCVREASTAELPRAGELADVADLFELLDSRLPSADERYPAGSMAGDLAPHDHWRPKS